jgi:hypothetical protein
MHIMLTVHSITHLLKLPAVSFRIHKIPLGQRKFIDKSILCQTFINFEATYQFLGIFKNN